MPHTRPSRRWLTCLFLSALSASVAGQRQASLKSITVTPDHSSVIIEADGVLPEPGRGTLQAPPRVYIDLPGVKPGPVKQATGGGDAITGVRVALNSADPLVTRVVIDLSAPAPYRIDSSTRTDGRITITIGSAAPASSPPVTAAPTGPATAAPSRAVPAQPTAPQTPATASAAPQKKPELAPAVVAAREKYLQQIGPSLAQIHDLEPTLTSIEKLAPGLVAADLQVVARVFETVARDLGTVKPPTVVMVQHDMLQRACGLGARAARLRADSLSSNDPSMTGNASSAAAGALMLIARARQELQ